jgi:hypothetical protein
VVPNSANTHDQQWRILRRRQTVYGLKSLSTSERPRAAYQLAKGLKDHESATSVIVGDRLKSPTLFLRTKAMAYWKNVADISDVSDFWEIGKDGFDSAH